MSKFFIRIAAVIMATGLVGCTNPSGGNETLPDTTELTTAINEAKTAKEGIYQADAADDVPLGLRWVTPEEMTAFETAIGEAEGAKAAAATQAEVNAVAAALETAIVDFNLALSGHGLGTKGSNFTQSHLDDLISSAEAAIAGVNVSINGENIPSDEKWVTQGDVDTLEAAIATARDASLTDNVYLALADALEVFNAAKKDGIGNSGNNGQKTLIIEGLTVTEGLEGVFLWDGVMDGQLTIGGYLDNPGQTLTVPLMNLEPANGDYPEPVSIWTGTGKYYVLLWYEEGAENEHYITTNKVFITSAVTTLSFTDFKEYVGGEDRGEQIGEIHGTIDLTNIPVSPSGSKRPVYISASSYNGTFSWNSHSSRIDLSNVSGFDGDNIAWAIPLYEDDINSDSHTWDDITGQQTVYFRLYVDFGSDSGLEVHFDGKDLDLSDKESIDASLGTASLAYITLSGTITVTYNSQPAPIVEIVAETSSQSELGGAYPRMPGAGTQWTIYIPPFASPAEVRFNVRGMDSEWGTLFEENTVITISVSNQSISDITINLGNISDGGEAAQVYYINGSEYQGEDLTVKATFVDDPVGYIRSGKLTFNLAQAVPVLPDDAPKETSLPDGLESIPANVKCHVNDDFRLINGSGTNVGDVAYANEDFTSCVLFIYFEEPCTVSGTTTAYGTTETYDVTFNNIAFAQGWNMVLIANNEATRIYDLPSGLKWRGY
jgi:hypothetical protein